MKPCRPDRASHSAEVWSRLVEAPDPFHYFVVEEARGEALGLGIIEPAELVSAAQAGELQSVFPSACAPARIEGVSGSVTAGR